MSQISSLGRVLEKNRPTSTLSLRHYTSPWTSDHFLLRLRRTDGEITNTCRVPIVFTRNIPISHSYWPNINPLLRALENHSPQRKHFASREKTFCLRGSVIARTLLKLQKFNRIDFSAEKTLRPIGENVQSCRL